MVAVWRLLCVRLYVRVCMCMCVCVSGWQGGGGGRSCAVTKCLFGVVCSAAAAALSPPQLAAPQVGGQMITAGILKAFLFNRVRIQAN